MSTTMTSTQKLLESMRTKASPLCVGLDPEPEKIPAFLLNDAFKRFDDPNKAMAIALLSFLRPIMEAVAPYASAFKPQSAFYERYGGAGIYALEEVIAYGRELGLPVILDAKRGDGGPTAEAYADAYLGRVPYWDVASQSFVRNNGPLHVEALTIQPGLGDACLMHFFKRAKEFGTCPIVVTKSSFKPNSFVEMLETDSNVSAADNGVRVWMEIANHLRELCKELEMDESLIGVVMGATYPEDTPFMREILKHALFLVPGYGAQGGGADGAVVGTDPAGLGCAVNSSRGILYAYSEESFINAHDDFQSQFALAAGLAAKAARDDLVSALERAGKKMNA